jgi:outer membrane protein OmpA-like peptidoglycan-associated protein
MTVSRTHPAALAAALALALGAGTAHAEPSSGVDAALYRPSFDSFGLFSMESGQVLPKHDLSFKLALGFAQKPLSFAVPGIESDASDDILAFAIGLHLAAGFGITDKLELVLEAGLYRTDPDQGYGERGLYRQGGQSEPSTGLLSLRPLSNVDKSGTIVNNQNVRVENTGLSGPFDARVGIKYRVKDGPKLKVAALATAFVPFGDEEMFLGDSNFVFEPRLAVDYWLNATGSTKVVLNLGARIRERTVLEAYDTDPTLSPLQTPDDAKAVLDVGSEAIAGGGVQFEALPQLLLGAETMFFVPLPKSLSYNHGSCRLNNGRRCGVLADDNPDNGEYFNDAGYGDLAAYVVGGLNYRATPDTALTIGAGAGLIGARRDGFRVMGGVTWQPTPAGTRVIGRGDRDGDGNPDATDICPDEPEDKDGYQDDDGCPDLDNDGDGIIDATDTCPNEPEDKDGYQDDDGCPERDNDGDGVPDVTDRCPNVKEDKDGFEDDDGCPDEDNDGDGIKDADDKCPNKPETVNGFQDDDGCPDAAQKGGPILGVNRIDLRGSKIAFDRRNRLTTASRTILDQIAAIMKDKTRPRIRVEVHVPLSTRSKNKRRKAIAQRRDQRKANARARTIFRYLLSKGVARQQLQWAGIGSRLPVVQPAWQAANERVDFIRVRR